MKAVIQRVSMAKVTVDGKIISEIGRGMCVLVGICNTDTLVDVEFICKKILNTRLFEFEGKRWMQSVKDQKLEILSISQFTLHYKLKGNKPDFHNAMPGEQAQSLYKDFLETLAKDYDHSKIKDGVFGALMEVNLINDGPVTIEFDSKKQK